MRHQARQSGRRFWRAVGALVVSAATLWLMPPAVAQFGGGGGGIGGGGGGIGGGGGGIGGGGGGIGGGGIGGGGAGGGAGGIVVDARGVLRMQTAPDARLSAQHLKAAVAALPGDLKKAAPLRKVALSRLEAEVAKAVAAGRGIPDELAKLAGLTRVQYVFVYPATEGAAGEIVLAGPAEPWITDPMGRVLGVESGRPTVLLEDLAAAIRCFPPGHPQDAVLGCSIDPRPEGLAAMQQFIAKIGRVNPQAGVDAIVQGLKESLGPQTVTVQGVSPTTHFAQVLVEADYRMKLIGIGLERPPVAMKAWVDLASAGSVATPTEMVTRPPGCTCPFSKVVSATERRSRSATSSAAALSSCGSSTMNSSPP